ncbi:MAG: hypothetical protein WDO72_05695 [Pseudomonadota bacterium]
MTDPLRTDMNAFLFTPIAEDANGMHLTMLSALARSGVDPWMEAAGLAALSRENATQKLVQMLAKIPNGPSPGDDTANLAAHLVAHLHAAVKPRSVPIASPVGGTPGGEAPRLSFAMLPGRVKLAIYSLVVLLFVAMCFRALASRDTAAPTDIGQQQSQ